MNQFGRSFLLIFLFGLITCTGCSGIEIEPQGTSTSEIPYQTSDGVPLGANLNCPDRSSFGYLEENVPALGVAVESPILFRWYYYPSSSFPTDWSTVCVPTSFTLFLSPGPEYTDIIQYSVTPLTIESAPSYLLFTTQLSETLLPNTTYRWIVVGHNGDIDIDVEDVAFFSEHSSWNDSNDPIHFVGQFQTGPLCTLATIQMVNLINPADSSSLETVTPFFQWNIPGCNALAYKLTFATDLLFNNIERNWVTNQKEFLMLPNILEPCVQYFWKVDAGVYSQDYHITQGNWATTSPIRTFIIRSENCPNAVANWITNAEVDGSTITINPNCMDQSDFGNIEEDVPALGAIVNTPILFRWEYFPNGDYPIDWGIACIPNTYTLYLSTGPDYLDAYAYPILSPTVTILPNSLLLSTQFSELLQPHTSYRWIVTGQVGMINIDQDQLTLFPDHMAWNNSNNPSALLGQFQTGPICTYKTLKTIDLLNPPDNEVLNSDPPIFQWDIPDCSAQAYKLTFSTDPNFNEVYRSWAIDQTEFILNPNPLQACVQYYWKVEAGIYDVDYHIALGDWQTTSETRTFIIQSQDCPNASANWIIDTVTPTATYVVPTMVWPTATQNPPTKTPKPTEVVCESISDATTCNSFSQCQWIPDSSAALDQGDCVTK
jgi:hypothetical protein